ncbi:Oidioi.mRNA.OKI2018_I69.chr1.g1918.t1.cds [Oikopleura dioica]|uniref:XK-related protein n=1 Tax=Oikopleura dioica TaxID=34765 RepID=A0ABN7SSX6_OIKDI|nr:Oidioi.mRNA.OKI2018_I69.chr1.g1918.t1.cds [Oikopleura dioica]
MFLYIFDVGSDISLGITYLTTENYVWGVITLLIVLFAGSIIAWTSYNSQDISENERKSISVKIIHAFLLGPLYHMFKEMGSTAELGSDLLKIRFIEATTEAAPQLFLQFHVIYTCRQTENITNITGSFCHTIRDREEINEMILPILALVTSLLSFTWTITSQKRVVQFSNKLNGFYVFYIFIMFLLQIFTRIYLLLFILHELDETWGTMGVIFGFVIPLILHYLILFSIGRKNSQNEWLQSFSKLFFFDLDDKNRLLGLVNTVIINLEHISFLIASFLIYKYLYDVNPRFDPLSPILISTSLLLNLLWYFVLSRKFRTVSQNPSK